MAAKQGRWQRVLWLGVALMVAACSAPRPSRVTRNRDWTPVISTVNGVAMVKVPPGCFVMGSADGRRDERPLQRLCFERAYWIDRYEVTNQAYGSAGAYPGDQRPRENLTWFEAREHCQRRGARLPTEAEWEYAARGPDNLIYPWGDALIGGRLQYDKRSGETVAVGSFPNGVAWVGAHDLSGNVWEWVSSQYRPYPYDAADGREDEADTTAKRVFRGGWLSYVDRGTSAVMRFRMSPDQRDWRVGFRCAQTE
jgi:formylglycine-generating enzyme required for sulfatase activity